MAFDAIFQPLTFRNLTVKNRILRSNISGRFDNYDGSGTQVQDVNKLLKMHRQMADMMKMMGGKGKGGGLMRGMMGGLGGFTGRGACTDADRALARAVGVDDARAAHDHEVDGARAGDAGDDSID